MKVIHNPLVNYMKGTTGSAVLYPGPSKKYSIQRTYAYPTLTANNHTKGAIMKNMRLVWLTADPAYRADWKTYAQRFYSEHSDNNPYAAPVNNSFGCFYKAMWNWHKSDPTHIELETVTVSDMVVMDSPLCAVNTTVDAGFTDIVSDYEELDAPIEIV